jgi:hypothetical protein
MVLGTSKRVTRYQGNTPLDKKWMRVPTCTWHMVLGTSKRVTRYQGNTPPGEKWMRVPRLPQAPLASASKGSSALAATQLPGAEIKAPKAKGYSQSDALCAIGRFRRRSSFWLKEGGVSLGYPVTFQLLFLRGYTTRNKE